jgi:hypothetical protein
MTLASAALAYSERLAWAVLPLRGKVPAIPKGRGYLDATTDPATISRWWGEHPDANVGVSCVGSGLVVLDVDPRHGGDRTLAEFEERHGILPPTVRQVTGGGGQHILFRPGGDSPPGSLGKGIDVKWRGHIVTAPSVHPDTGRCYAWLPDLHPLRTPVAEMPAWLAELLSPPVPPPPSTGQARPAIEETIGWGPYPRYSRAALLSAYENISSAPIGQQDVTLTREAFGIGTLVGAGAMPRTLAIDMLVDAGLQMVNAPGRRPWTGREIQEKVARSLSAGERHPRAVAA